MRGEVLVAVIVAVQLIGGIVVGAYHFRRTGSVFALLAAMLLGPFGWIVAALERPSPFREAEYRAAVETEIAIRQKKKERAVPRWPDGRQSGLFGPHWWRGREGVE